MNENLLINLNFIDLHFNLHSSTPHPYYNTIVGVQTNFCVSYPIHVITSNIYSYIAKLVFNDHLGSSNDMCYIKNHVIMNCVLKRLRCN